MDAQESNSYSLESVLYASESNPYSQESASCSQKSNVHTFESTRDSYIEEMYPMSQKTDWLPSDRTGQLTMAKDWHGVAGGKRPSLGHPRSNVDRPGNPYPSRGHCPYHGENRDHPHPGGHCSMQGSF
jgi:hypothetical protein